MASVLFPDCRGPVKATAGYKPESRKRYCMSRRGIMSVIYDSIVSLSSTLRRPRRPKTLTFSVLYLPFILVNFCTCTIIRHKFKPIERWGRKATGLKRVEEMNEELTRRIETLAQWIYESRYIVVFTGAGISTESGLPDFRGPDGLWTRRDKGLPPRPMGGPWDDVEPNAGHLAIVELQKLDKLKFLISQNVDNLHLKSGIRPVLLAELHGNIARLRCSRCEETVDRKEGQTRCRCGGSLVKSVVDFGESLPQKDLMLSYEHAGKSDLFVVVGSSLVVTPAADMPREALRSGAKLVIINQGETPFDRAAGLRFHERIGDVLPRAVKRLKRLMGLFE